MRIIFMGTPDFAVASLRSLLDAGIDIVGVITAPDKPAGRGQKLQASAVKLFAEQRGLTILQPTNLKDPAFLEELRSLKADLQVVVAFRMLPEAVWNMPPKGTINLHASLLPQYRGAAPINWAIINGETKTGVSTFFLKQEIDTGDILFSEEVSIDKDDTAGDLLDKLMNTGSELLVRTVKAIGDGNYQEKSQESFGAGELKTAPKIFKETCLIDWNQPAQKVYDLIRGLSPYPTAYCRLGDKNLKIFKAATVSPADTAESAIAQGVLEPGTFLTDNKTYLHFACADGYISLSELQLEGKKRMGVEEFLRGVRL